MSAQPAKIQNSQPDSLMNVFYMVTAKGQGGQMPIIIKAGSNETIFRTSGK